MSTTNVSRETFVWSHVGVIVFHVLIAVFLMMSQQRDNWWGYSSKNMVYGLACLLLIVSILSIIPIAKHDTYHIEGA